MKHYLLIFCCLTYLSGIRAKDGEVKVYPHGREFTEIRMQRIVAAVFRITHTGSVKQVFISGIILGFCPLLPPNSVKRQSARVYRERRRECCRRRKMNKGKMSD